MKGEPTQEKKKNSTQKDKNGKFDEIQNNDELMIDYFIYFKNDKSLYFEIYLEFDLFSQVEEILSKKRYLVGSQFTEADIRLFTTLVRFDMVYVGHFKV